MHALPLAVADLPAALLAGTPPANGPVSDDLFRTHLSAAAGGQATRTTVPGQRQTGAPGSTRSVVAPIDDRLPGPSDDEEPDAEAMSLDQTNATGLVTTWFPWQASSGAERAGNEAGKSTATKNNGSGSAMGRLLAAIVTREDGRLTTPGHSPATVDTEQQSLSALPADPSSVGVASAAATESEPPAAAKDAAISVAASAASDPQATLSDGQRATTSAVPQQLTAPTVHNAPPITIPQPAAQTPEAQINVAGAASQPPAVFPQDAFSRAASPTSESAINHLDQKNPSSAGGQRLDPMGPDIHFSRIITVQQQAAPAESDLPEVVAVNTAPAISGQQVRQDVADLAIRSHLPSDAPASVRGNGEPQQEAAGSKEHNRPADTGSRQAESLQARRPVVVSGQDGPLLFALQQEVAASPASSTAGVESAGVRLPSGLIVPDSAAMDQLLTHLSQQSKLAITTIQLRLNPQELGELRMEIKVKQDNITAHIIAQNPQAQEMIDRHLPRLREALEQQGLHLQQVEVTLATSDNTDSQRFHDNPNRQLASAAPGVRTSPSAFVPSGTETVQPAAAPAHGLNVVA